MSAFPLNSKVQAALAFHQKGLLDQAEHLYREVLVANPNQVESIHLLGVASSQRGRHSEAVEWFERALELEPSNPHYHFNLGVSLEELGKIREAADCYGQAGSLDRRQAEPFLNQGNCLYQLGDLRSAEVAYRQAISARPYYPAAHSNFGNLLHETGRLEEALSSHRQALEFDDTVDRFHFNLGNVLKDLSRFEEALVSYDRALALRPDYRAAILNRGGVLMELGLYDQALVAFEQVVLIDPYEAKGHLNRGNALVAMSRFDEAIQCFEDAGQISPNDAQVYLSWGNALIGQRQIDAAIDRFSRAVDLDPKYAQAFSNLGSALKAASRFSDAIRHFELAIRLEPMLAEAHWNKSLLLLLQGDFETGWGLYEWRWKTKEYLKHPCTFAQPLWLGQAEFGGVEGLAGKTILVHSEQGLGDTIQFARYLPLLAECGARVVFELPEVLLGTLQGIPGINAFVVKGQALPPSLPAADFHCPLLSLPLAFKTTLETIPTPRPYLEADAQKVEQWSVRLGPKSRPRIGLVWSGNSKHKNDHNRSLSLELLLSELPERFDWVSLQREVREADQQVLELHPSVHHFGAELEDFTDTAALCALMDLVISVDTSVAHLSGALGRPTWVLLPHVPDWRWLLDRDDSPWYLCVKLYRQPAPGEWGSVFQRLSNDLLKFDQSSSSRAVRAL